MKQLVLAVVILVVSCNKHTINETAGNPDSIIAAILFPSKYPDCFTSMSSSTYYTRNCGSTFVTAELSKNEIITVYLDEQLLELKTTCKTFRFDTVGVNIKYYTHANHPDSVYYDRYPFCSDVLFINQGQLIPWTVVSGTVTAVVSREKAQRERCERYQVSMRLDNVRFTYNNLDTTISTLIFKDRLVYACIP